MGAGRIVSFIEAASVARKFPNNSTFNSFKTITTKFFKK